ncbi:MAG: NAD(P)H-hydrate dehydratase [Candidatus Omnitrophica bacterium]|nr:NAD(P)H-hydrate dehydratase [Candidatus Omnitrophota bacterium]MDD5574690.1 NAD(P)H-hydrate dehydratase [Candidatus Omnitrophota bacterium]
MQWPAPFFKRKCNAHKNDFGHLLVLAGSRRYAGAGCLCANAAMRAGAGLVTLGIPESLYPVYAKKLTEVMLLPLADAGRGVLSKKSWPVIKAFLKKVDGLLIGPGLSQDKDIRLVVRQAIKNALVPLVIDADGLNALAGDPSILKTIKAPAVLTPHPKEMARLMNASTAMVQKNRKKVAKDFAYGYNMTLVLKGHETVVASPDKRIYINKTGNPGMATAGAGDVLSGIVAAFLGQGMEPFEAACRAVYIHGLAGDLAAKDKTEPGMIASDIIEYLPKAFKKVSIDG